MWTLFASPRNRRRSAENGPILHSFSRLELTGRHADDCYTFEYVASDFVEIHNPYYYHYKRSRFSLKEEGKWS